MKSPIVIFVIIALVVLAGFGVYSLSQNSSQSDSMINKDEVMLPNDKKALMEPAEAMMKKDEQVTEGDNMMAGSRYVMYSKSLLESSSSNRRVLFFYASWCPICKPADASFREKENKIPRDVRVIRVNYNDSDTDQEEKDLAKKYGITYQHTFVQIDNSGKEVSKWNGGGIDELLTNLR